MKKHNSFLVCGISVLLLFSCKDKSAFTIAGEFKNAGDIKKVYLLEADSAQVNKVDSAELGSDGKFEFKHQSATANLYKLSAGKAVFDLIAKNGDDINFSTDMRDTAHAYQVSGSDESEKIKEFNAISNHYGDLNTKLVSEYQIKAEATKNQDSLVKIYQPAFEKNMDEYSKQVLAFVDKNKKSLAAFYAMLSVDPYRYEQQMVAYADDIAADFKGNTAVERFKQQMKALKPVSVGQPAPNFTSNDLNGKPVQLADYKGKYVLVDFWASWCGPCRNENPNVVRLYNTYKSKGLNILGVSLDESKGDWQKAINDDRLTWNHVSDLQKFDGPTEQLYHIEAIPSNFLIDPQGKIIAKNVTGKNLEDVLNKTFANL